MNPTMIGTRISSHTQVHAVSVHSTSVHTQSHRKLKGPSHPQTSSQTSSTKCNTVETQPHTVSMTHSMIAMMASKIRRMALSTAMQMNTARPCWVLAEKWRGPVE